MRLLPSIRLPFRPGFWGITLTLGLVTPPSFAVLAQRYADPSELRERSVREAEALVSKEFQKLGWVTIAPDVAAVAGVELLQAERYFVLPIAPATVTGEAASGAPLARAARLVAAELGRYPATLVERARLRRVLLCTGLREAGSSIPSLPNYERTLLLDVDGSTAYLRRILHHEVYHFIDYAVDSRVGHDAEWQSLNGPWAVYGSGGRFMRQPGSAKLTEAVPGFLTRYSTSAPEEDQAEVFALAMTAPGDVARVAARDPVVAAKLRLIQRRVSDHVSAMDAAFWREVAAGRR